MRELVEDIAKALVDKPDEVVVNVTEDKGITIFKLTVAEDDMGKVIGKQGRIAKAIRTVVRSVANKEKIKVTLEII
ncbi:MAG: KH domain-containing protein [Clostridioides difficile]|nr:KH domain-containing protein [Clostridioides sp.]MBS5786399.1 KH domain-containing protein [Clostridioides difficile]